MRVLFLAPHPFYQDRGTPIAVDLLLRSLSKRGYSIDLVTYHEGKTPLATEYESIEVHRIFSPPFIRNIRPGFSWKKLFCDFFVFLKAFSLVLRKQYDVVHAVEESVFMALVLKFLFGIPYVYDMDSSLSQQLIEKYPLCSFISPFLELFEKIAVRNAEAVVPVCDFLAVVVEKYNPRKVTVLRDVSLLNGEENSAQLDLKKELGIGGLVVMYVGNLETYQGIDLLLESFALVLKKTDKADLVIIGGNPSDIKKYKEKSLFLGIEKRVHFIGPKPLYILGKYLSQADILVSPRIKGGNTPMKIYSYLHSGKAILATKLLTHTQVLDEGVALLVAPSPEEFSSGMLKLIQNEGLRVKLGEAGKKLIEEKYNYECFKKELYGLYDWLEKNLASKRVVSRQT